MDLNHFAEDFHQEVLSQCDGEDSARFREDTFTEVMIDYLKQANEVDDGEVCYHKHDSRGEKVNGFSVSSDGECLDLFVCSFGGTVPPPNVPNSEVKTHFKRLLRFFEAALDAPARGFEDASPIFDAAQQMYVQREELTKARFFFLTDGVVKNAEVEDTTINGVEIQHFIWDIEKLHRFVTSGMQREVIEINFADEFDGAVPCVGTADATDEYCTYLAFFPGALLAKLYGEYGPRLLEKNVRSFLQAKGKINKGIRDTILNEPHRFLAYNNGIAATAEQIKVERPSNGLRMLSWARDFQIVNGGQTTASIYHAFKKHNADLSKLVIQVKLTVLTDPQKIAVFVPLISRYANSQNKVNAADFSANHPYHVAMEELSRTIWAPAGSGTERQTHWYYERARGSYLDDKSRQGTPARIRAFESLNPLRQKFTKTDLAKFENTWNQYPHLVCMGAEKNFIKFTELFIEKGHPAVDVDYCQRLIAKAILFKRAEKIVSEQNYGGFRANIVTYTLAWLCHHTAQKIDLERVWRDQDISKNLTDSIRIVSEQANAHILNPPPNRRNPGEWSKHPDCWADFRDKTIKLPPALQGELVQLRRAQDSRYAQNTPQNPVTHDAETLRQIGHTMEISADTWFKVSNWAKETDNLAPWQRGLAFSLGRLASQKKAPSPKQAAQGLKIIAEAQRLGFKNEG
jgi:AIPR protein